MKKALFIILGLIYSSAIYAQVEKSYKSIKLGYEIKYPNEYIQYIAKRPEVDFAAKDGFGGSIVINRGSDENIKYYDEMTESEFEKLIKQTSPNFDVFKFYKSNVGGRKAIFVYSSATGSKSTIKQINCLIYNGKYLYTITASTFPQYFEKEENNFLKTINSIKFN